MKDKIAGGTSVSTIIYINNDNLQIVNKNGKNYQYESVDLEEGTILNGVITNPDEIVNQLKARKTKFKQVTLVVGSSNIQVKRMIASKISKKDLLGYVREELAIDEKEEYVYDLNILKKDNGEYHLLGYAAPKELVDDFMEVFKLAGVKIKRFDVTINCVIKYLRKASILSGKTYLMTIVSGVTIVSLLVENGMYKLTTRMRMIHEPDSKEYLLELKKKLFTMLERCYEENESLKGKLDIYYMGLQDDQMELLKESMQENEEGEFIKSYKELNRDMNYIYPIMGEIVHKNDVNFCHVKKITTKVPQSKWAMIIQAGIVVLIVVPSLAYTINLNQKNQEMDDAIAALEKYIDAKEAENQEDGGSTLGSVEVLNQIDQYTWLSEKVESSQKLSMEMLSQIYEAVDMQVFTYVEQDNTVYINGNLSAYNDITAFASTLRETNYFTEQYYKGYSIVTNENGSVYNFNIEGTLNTSGSGVAADD